MVQYSFSHSCLQILKRLCLCFQAVELAKEQAKKMLQMPPLLPERKPIDDVLSVDQILEGMLTAKYAFTDISFNVPHRVGDHHQVYPREGRLLWCIMEYS